MQVMSPLLGGKFLLGYSMSLDNSYRGMACNGERSKYEKLHCGYIQMAACSGESYAIENNTKGESSTGSRHDVEISD